MYRDNGSFTRPSHAVAAATAAGDVDDNVECSSQIQDEAFCEGPSLHTIQKQANAAVWERIRHQLLRAIMESKAMPQNQLNVKCNDVVANLRCRKCNPSALSFLSTAPLI